MNYDNIIEVLKGILDEKRLKHSIGVMKCAAELAKRNNIDKEKAKIAGLLHDCAKCQTLEKMQELCSNINIVQKELFWDSKCVLHGFAGAEMIKNRFNIVDKEIIEAVRYHTIGKKDMTKLQKIIYLADLIEPGRSFDKVKSIRKQARANLDAALVMAYDLTIQHIIKKGGMLHFYTVEARNELVAKRDFY